MHKLAKMLESTACDPSDIHAGKGIFTEAASVWAKHCLETYKGRLLRRGLKISTALVEFEIEMNKPTI